MFPILTPIPNNSFIACSGGIDSMVLLDFVRNGNKNPIAAYFNHGTAHGDDAEAFLSKHCAANNIELVIGRIANKKSASQSQEEYWRTERYNFFRKLKVVLTAHHLGDAVEWWIFTSLHGCGKLMPSQNGNVLRPLLATPKSEIKNWAERKGIQYIDDPSNDSRDYMRNIIRHDIVPHALEVNPGLETVIRKKYQTK